MSNHTAVDFKHLIDMYCEKNNISQDVQSEHLYVLLDKLQLQSKDKAVHSWDICQLNIEDLLIFGGHNEINFESLSGVTGIFSGNSSGKSSIIDIISFILFGKITRENNSDASKHILNTNATSGYGQLIFLYNDTFFCIEKRLTMKKHTTKVENSLYELSFDMQNTCKTFVFRDSFIYGRDICDANKNMFEQKVNDIFGSHAFFMSMSVKVPTPNIPFILDMSPTNRKKLIFDMLGINISEDEYNENRCKLMACRKEIKGIQNEIAMVNRSSKELFKDDIEKKIHDLRLHKTELHADLLKKTAYETKRKIMEQQGTSLHGLLQEHEHVNSKLKLYKTQMADIQSDIDSLNTLLKNKESILEHKNQFQQKIKNKLCKYRQSIQEMIAKMPVKYDISDADMEFYQMFHPSDNIEQLLARQKDLTSKLGKSDRSQIHDELLAVKAELNCLQKQSTLLLDKMKQIRKNHSSNIEVCVDDLRHLTQQQKELNDTVNIHERTIETLSIQQKNAHLNISMLQTEQSQLKSKISELKSSIHELAHVEFNTDCECCMRNPGYTLKQTMKKELAKLEEKSSMNYSRIQDEMNQTQKIDIDKITNEEHLSQLKKRRERITKQIKLIHDDMEHHNYIDSLQSDRANVLGNISKCEKLRIKLENLEQISDHIEQTKTAISKANLHADLHVKIQHNKRIHEQLNTQTDEITKLTKKCSALENYRFSEYEELCNAIEKHRSLSQQLAFVQESVKDFEARNKTLVGNIDTIKSTLNNSDVSENIDVDMIKAKYDEVSTEIEQLERDICRFEHHQTTIRNLNLKYDALASEQLILNAFDKMLGKNGIALFLVEEVLPLIENFTNSIITKYTTKHVKLFINNDQICLHVLENSSNVPVLCGGMEQFTIEMAMRTAFLNVVRVPHSTFLFIDEGFSVFDEANIHMVPGIFDLFRKHFKHTILISHQLSLKEQVDNVVSIQNGKIF